MVLIIIKQVGINIENTTLFIILLENGKTAHKMSKQHRLTNVLQPAGWVRNVENTLDPTSHVTSKLNLFTYRINPLGCNMGMP